MKIRLNTQSASNQLDAFMADFYDATSPNPLDDRERLYGMAGATIYPAHGAIHISDLRTFDARKGHAGRLMGMLCDLADKHGVDLTLFAKSYNNGPMTTKKLAEWYSRIGFTKKQGNVKDGYAMRRAGRR